MSDHFFEKRAEMRYPFYAGYVEVQREPHPLLDISIGGIGFRAESFRSFDKGDDLEGFLILQALADQHEIPVALTVRFLGSTQIGCAMRCQNPDNAHKISTFVGKLGLQSD